MSEPWILAIDLGNGGPKVGAVSLDGRVLAAAVRSVSTQFGDDGTATQDALAWQAQVKDGVGELLRTVGPDDLHAVAITGQWGSSVPVAADGRPAGPVLLWADSRAAKFAEPLVGGMVAGYNPAKVLPWLYRTGGAPSTHGTDPTGHSLLLTRELQDVAARTVVVLEPVDYLAFWFTARALATPASMTLSWITDNRMKARLGYDPGLLRRARRNPAWLPELVPTGTVQGPLLPEVAQLLGVRAGVPVVTGVPDFLAAVIGSGAVAPFQTHLAISTTAWFSARVPFKKTDLFHQIASVPGLDPNNRVAINNIDAAGAALHWLRAQVLPEFSYPDLDVLAALAPAGSGGVLFTPWLAGERSPVEDKDIRAAWLNVSYATDRAALVRSVLEGVAFNARWLFDPYLKFLGRDVPSIRLLGGGAQSDLWAQILAGVLDRPIERVADPRDGQLRGVAQWAQVCLGERTLGEVGRDVVVDRVFLPEDTDREEYQRLFGEYRRLYGQLKGTYKRLNSHRR